MRMKHVSIRHLITKMPNPPSNVWVSHEVVEANNECNTNGCVTQEVVYILSGIIEPKAIRAVEKEILEPFIGETIGQIFTNLS